MLDRLRELNRETSEVLRAARQERNHELRLKAISRAEKQLELEGKLLGELQDSGSPPKGVGARPKIILLDADSL